MKKSFFSRFKDKLNQDYGGRFFSLLLKEIMIEEPRVINIVFPSLKQGDYTPIGIIDIKEEFSFDGKNSKKRRADLAILKRNKPIALLEVKYEDEKKGENPAQLEDYLAYCSEKKIPFTYLTQYLPPKSDLDLINDKNRQKGTDSEFQHMSYSCLFKKIEGKNHAVIMFKDFLKTEVTVFTKAYDIDEKEDVLKLFLSRCIYPSHDSGLNVMPSSEKIYKTPELLSLLIDNTASLGDAFFEMVGKKHNCRKKPSIGFIVKQDDSGGEFSTEAYSVFSYQDKNKTHQYRIVFGFQFILERGKDISKNIYVRIYARGTKAISGSCKYNYKDSEDMCLKKVFKTLNKVIEKYLQDNTRLNRTLTRNLIAIKKSVTRLIYNS